VIGDQVRHFCCRGCQGAYQIISGAGLERFYRQRDWSDPGIAAGAFETSFNPELLDSLVQQREHGHELTFLLEGIRCASCVWLIERILLGVPGVQDARINYGTTGPASASIRSRRRRVKSSHALPKSAIGRDR
jgi:Cu2+-exporting ATPase